MKKIYLLLLLFSCGFFCVISAKAYQNTVCYNLSEGDCKKFSTCKWSLDDEGNSGQCSLKNYTLDYSKKYCKYRIKVYSGNENKEVTCNFWISSVSDEDLLIQYRDDDSKSYGELNENQDSFTCFSKGVVFYNMNLDKKLNAESANSKGEWVVIYDFKKRWNEIYKNNGECPKISFANAATGSFHVYFTEEEKDPPYNVGITEDAEPDDEQTEDDSGELRPGDIIENKCEVIPLEIRKWINNILKFIRYVALALVIALGALDFMKAAGDGNPDAMKKAGQSFMKRMIAVVILFLLPVIVDFILNMVNIYGVDPNNIDCLQNIPK